MKHHLLGLCLSAVSVVASAQTIPVNPNTVLAPWAGRHATPAGGQSAIGFYGTDLGFTVKHAGNLRILFGDSWSNANGALIGPIGDDSQAAICLQSSGCPGGAGAALFTDGDAVESYVNAHPPQAGELPWQREAPPLYFRLNAFALVAPMPVYRGGVFGTLLNMGLGRTPVAAFSNAKSGASGAVYAVFNRVVSMQCSGGFFPSCSDNFTCDTGLGSLFGSGEEAIPCLLGTAGCAPIPAGGFCVDPTNSFYGNTAQGRLLSVVSHMQVGNADPSLHEVYYTKSWYTRKFFNITVRAVNDFSPSRANGVGNDYNPPDGITTGREKLLIWGRPGFVSARNNGRPNKLYFAYVDLPNYDANGSFAWAPQYYTGTVGGVPQFSSNQTLAQPLDLSGLADGLSSADTEKWDIVDQMSIAFVPGLNKWVMLYGGNLNPDLADLFSGGQGSQVVFDPQGAIHARWSTTDDPWSAWSTPKQLLIGGNPSQSPPAAGTQYTPGGILHHGGCVGSTCAPYEPAYLAGNAEYGFLYAPNIVEEWTEDRGTYVELYWNVSTWNPYQVVLMKSRIDK